MGENKEVFLLLLLNRWIGTNVMQIGDGNYHLDSDQEMVAKDGLSRAIEKGEMVAGSKKNNF